MTKYATGTVQEDGRYRYSFRADSSGGSGRAEVLIETVDPQSVEELAAEAALAEEATGAVMDGTGGRFPRTLAEYVGAGTGAEGARSTLVLRVPRGKGQFIYLEPAIQDRPDLLPVTPKVVRKIAVDVYEALAVLHGVGYAHGAVNTSSLLWNWREAVLARYHRVISDPDGRRSSIDVADAARLIYHVATGRPLSGELTHSAHRELNSRLSGLGDLVAAALDPPDRRISAAEARDRARQLVPVGENAQSDAAPAPRREDTPEEAAARREFRELRVEQQDARRRRHPPEPPPEPRWPTPDPGLLKPRSPWRVLLDEGVGPAARQLLDRAGGPATRPLAVGTAAVLLVIILGVLLGRML